MMNGPAAAPPPPAQPEPVAAEFAAAMQAAEIVDVINQLQQQQQQRAQADEQGNAAAAMEAPPAPAPAEPAAREGFDAYLDGLTQVAREQQREQRLLEEPLMTEEDEDEETRAEPVASTSRVQLGQSPSPFDTGRAPPSEENIWVDLSDEEVESALIPGRRRSMATAEDSEDEWSAGAVRSGPRGSAEARRRRREERNSREERARRRASRQASAEPSFQVAPSSPDRPIRPLPSPRTRSSTPFVEQAPPPPPNPPRLAVAAPQLPPAPPLRAEPPQPVGAFRFDNLALAQVLAQDARAAQPPNIADQDFLDEEEDVFVEDIFDDLDGVLEAIGMKGSLLTLVQHLG